MIGLKKRGGAFLIWSDALPQLSIGQPPDRCQKVKHCQTIQLVSISESYWLTCKYSWILGQSALSFMIRSISDRSAFKAWSPEPCKKISVSTHYDDLRSFAQIAISIPDWHKGLTFDRTYGQHTNVHKSARGFRWTSLTISYMRSIAYKLVRDSRLTCLTISYTRSVTYKSDKGS
jgi:hypothetical protein